MGKDEQTLREMAARQDHQTGSGLAVPDHAKLAAQWALGRIAQLEELTQKLQKVNDEIGPAYHEWRAYAEKLVKAMEQAKVDNPGE